MCPSSSSSLLCVFFFLTTSFPLIFTEENQFEFDNFVIYLDNQTLCNEGFVDLDDDVQTGRIFSHRQFHEKIFYASDHHCSITIRSRRRIWLSVQSFQSNSSSTFPRCTEAKFAGNDDRLQIIDGFRNGSILRILCGKDSDRGFDRTALILKSSLFTVDWRTKSQSLGFALRFVRYDLAVDGSCRNSLEQFRCRNQRCIDRRFLCLDEDFCADRSQLESEERLDRCATSKTFLSARKYSHEIFLLVLVVSSCSLLCLVICLWKILCRRKMKNNPDRFLSSL